jgi:hypothetical protein
LPVVPARLPRNGIGINFDNGCGTTNASSVEVGNVFTYNNYVETQIAGGDGSCVATQRGSLNHIEIRLSTTNVQVWASDDSPDGGKTFPNFKEIFSSPINLSFSQGYVHFQQAERAPVKYATEFNISPGYANNYWSDMGFDGPTVNTGEVGYSVPDALTPDPDSGQSGVDLGALNVGYALLNSPTTIASCCNEGNRTTFNSFSLPNVKTQGVTAADLTFDVAYTYAFGLTTSNTALQYSINGGPLLNPQPSSEPNYAAEDLCPGCPGNPVGGGGVPYSFPIPLNDLVSGTNTITFSVANSPNSYPPILTSLDLLTFTGNPPP